ncbi:hypothetical protein ANN_21206 [Periplaneta americana]|uniref:DUF4817 domain-containing protein n=1 Tax=Periplaneta americana TaxID=6978 RepID=A0ABQ8SEP6_PERAM|nr:hypothetical protein ANN_21206 [Periplaneta americana]
MLQYTVEECVCFVKHYFRSYDAGRGGGPSLEHVTQKFEDHFQREGFSNETILSWNKITGSVKNCNAGKLTKNTRKFCGEGLTIECRVVTEYTDYDVWIDYEILMQDIQGLMCAKSDREEKGNANWFLVNGVLDGTAKSSMRALVCRIEFIYACSAYIRREWNVDPPTCKSIYEWDIILRDNGSLISKTGKHSKKHVAEMTVDQANRELQIPRSTVHKILRERLRMHAYKLQLLYQPKPDDCRKRANFCDEMIRRIDENPRSITVVLLDQGQWSPAARSRDATAPAFVILHRDSSHYARGSSRLGRVIDGLSRVEFGTQPPTRLTIARIRDKFEVDGTVQNVLKGRCGRKRSSTDNESADAIMQAFAQSPKKSMRQCSREIGNSKSRSNFASSKMEALHSETFPRTTVMIFH